MARSKKGKSKKGADELRRKSREERVKKRAIAAKKDNEKRNAIIEERKRKRLEEAERLARESIDDSSGSESDGEELPPCKKHQRKLLELLV